MSHERVVTKTIGRAIHRFEMLAPGDRVLVGVSGGKDSYVLLSDLLSRRPRMPFAYEVEALHVRSDFAPPATDAAVARVRAECDAPFHVLDVGIRRRLKPGRSLSCYWCSTQRRLELIDYAVQNGFTKIALAHHLDDILETFFMNMMFRGTISTMMPVLRYDKYPVTIIRPLAMLEERSVVQLVEERGFSGAVCTCPFAAHSDRKNARARVEALTGGSSSIKRRIFESMGRVRTEYLFNSEPSSHDRPVTA
ncbi:MAG: tRNA 2-thiocytidine biosynthesis protein TtcA [Spirochaetaceae bacterium]|nr:MAG: tRNA 2-thiocytidine biosynthesis protein TtcA [Spirochaetaceae bacterium]